MKTIVVTEHPEYWQFLPEEIEVISADDYLTHISLTNNSVTHLSTRIINLCDSYHYQSLGYYTSLLAEACGHKVFPTVLTMQDLESHTFEAMINVELAREIQRILKPIQSDEFELSVYFGKNMAKRYDAFCRKLYMLFPLPLFRVYFKYVAAKKIWMIQKISALPIQHISESHQVFLQEMALSYMAKKRPYFAKKQTIYFDLAILHNPEEVRANNYTSPSNSASLKRFIDAGKALGIHAELIEKEDLKSLSEYDGLFIRETTAVNHYTYRFARQAMAERLVVVDDPVSILKCANKIYLAELLNKHHIPTPETIILSRKNGKEKIQQMVFPCVLKLPDSACSKGVKKAENREEANDILKVFLKSSELILAQSFMPSEFDWRIGIFDHKPLYACRYFMAKGHWQIYNWQEKAVKNQTGDTDSVPLKKVPSSVLEMALKATKLIGDGLYGVDLKQIGNQVYVIEINDNPSIDHGVEDELLGDALYEEIMQIFLKRMKRQHGYE